MAKKKKKPNRKQGPQYTIKKTAPVMDPAEGSALGIKIPDKTPSIPVSHEKITLGAPMSPMGRVETQLHLMAAASPSDQAKTERIYQQMADNLKTVRRLLTQYNDALIKNGYGLPQSALDQLDRIDIRGAKNAYDALTDSQKEINEHMMSTPNAERIYWVVPCFKEGVVRPEDGRKIYFNLLGLDLSVPSVKIRVMDYIDDSSGLGWQCGVSCVATIWMDGPDCVVDIDPDDTFNYSRIYSMLSRKRLGWTKPDYDLWKTSVVKNAVVTERTLAAQNTHNGYLLAKTFISAITMANHYLLKHRPVAKRTPAPHTGEPKQAILSPDTNPAPRVRTIGPITATSVSVPRFPSEKTVVKYTLASWNTRGHIRRYKSGRAVYVKPSVHHRKALANLTDGQNTPQSVVIIKPAPDDAENTPAKGT